MIHIESKSGKTYGICDMSEDHLINTIELLLKRCKIINKTHDKNPRYMSDIEENLKRLSLYFFDAENRGIINPLIKQEIEEVYHDYKTNRNRTFIRR